MPTRSAIEDRRPSGLVNKVILYNRIGVVSEPVQMTVVSSPQSPVDAFEILVILIVPFMILHIIIDRLIIVAIPRDAALA